MPGVGVREWFAVGQVIASGKLARYGAASGGRLSRFEARFAEAFGVKHALTMSSGTAALVSALAAAGVGPGDEVLVPAYTWIASAGAPLAVGATPVLVDIDETLTMDPADLERRITERSKAIIPVHMGNVVCNMDAITEIARARGLHVIEDACQAVGLRYKSKRVGTIGVMGAYSFNQFKNINVGEGGAVVTDDDRLFARARIYHDLGDVFRSHDEVAHDEPPFIGVNFKATEIQGAMLSVQLSKLEPMLRRMRSRRDAMVNILEPSTRFRVCPHNDPDNACGLHLIFETAEDAEAFSKANPRGVWRLMDTSRHVFTNWAPILEKRAAHPRMNPFDWAEGALDYAPENYARTLDILSRTCMLSVGQQYPKPLMEFLAKRMLR